MTQPLQAPGLDYDRPGGALRWVLEELRRRGHKPVPFGPGVKVAVKVERQGALTLGGAK